MQGFRTIITAVVSAIVTPWLLKTTGLELTPEAQLQLVAAIMALIMTGMRFSTSTPVFKNVPKPVIITAENILNHIDVSPRTSQRDVRRRIVQALHRNADLDAQQISVAVSDDIVTLSGPVRSGSERDAADRAAGSAPGIRHVENQIIVEPPQRFELDDVVVDPLC